MLLLYIRPSLHLVISVKIQVFLCNYTKLLFFKYLNIILNLKFKKIKQFLINMSQSQLLNTLT
jgi:hypothetical protein